MKLEDGLRRIDPYPCYPGHGRLPRM